MVAKQFCSCYYTSMDDCVCIIHGILSKFRLAFCGGCPISFIILSKYI